MTQGSNYSQLMPMSFHLRLSTFQQCSLWQGLPLYQCWWQVRLLSLAELPLTYASHHPIKLVLDLTSLALLTTPPGWYWPSNWATTLCTAVFLVAAFTDWLDGYLARKMVRQKNWNDQSTGIHQRSSGSVV